VYLPQNHSSATGAGSWVGVLSNPQSRRRRWLLAVVVVGGDQRSILTSSAGDDAWKYIRRGQDAELFTGPFRPYRLVDHGHREIQREAGAWGMAATAADGSWSAMLDSRAVEETIEYS